MRPKVYKTLLYRTHLKMFVQIRMLNKAKLTTNPHSQGNGSDENSIISAIEVYLKNVMVYSIFLGWSTQICYLQAHSQKRYEPTRNFDCQTLKYATLYRISVDRRSATSIFLENHTHLERTTNQ